MKLPPPITSRTNAKVKALRAALSGKASKAGDLVGLEGKHLVKAVHAAGYSFETVYLREGNESFLKDGWPTKIRTKNWAVLSSEVFDSAVSTTSPQDIAATWIIQDPKRSSAEMFNVLALEDIQDPGNLGTLIRSAVNFGFGHVAVTPVTANPWNPKVMRASAGAVVELPVIRAPIEKIVEKLRSQGIRIFAAVAGFDTPFSLAAAHGVLMGHRPDAPGLGGLVDAGFPSSPDGYAASFVEDTDFVQPCAIMIGNEGVGLSKKALSLADERVSIPGGFESLNAGVAGSIIMYEVMRQTKLRMWAKKQGLRK